MSWFRLGLVIAAFIGIIVVAIVLAVTRSTSYRLNEVQGDWRYLHIVLVDAAIKNQLPDEAEFGSWCERELRGPMEDPFKPRRNRGPYDYVRSGRRWLIHSYGPDGRPDLDSVALRSLLHTPEWPPSNPLQRERVYDPSNGLESRGDIILVDLEAYRRDLGPPESWGLWFNVEEVLGKREGED